METIQQQEREHQVLTTQRNIPFSPPDIGQAEIDAVVDVLRSGWITTGPRTKQLESELREFTGAAGVVCLNSATAALECALRLCDIGPGDEVIVPAYTYTASASVVTHVGATLVLVDVAPGSFHVDPTAVAAALTPRTKAVLAVDIAGVMADYDALLAVLENYEGWQPANEIQAFFTRPILISDAAHALGASRLMEKKGLAARAQENTLADQGEESMLSAGSIADFTAFSFHAVKNFTTAEGGAIAWRHFGYSAEDLYRLIMLYALHGQTKDALHKSGVGAWEYDIAFPGYKWNMTDIQAALGLVQLQRYPQFLTRRRELVEHYEKKLDSLGLLGQGGAVELLNHFTAEYTSSAHLMLARVVGATEAQRNAIIEALGQAGVAANVHFKPLPLLTAYKDLGFDIADYPHAFAQYKNEITLPLHTLLSKEDIDYICEQLARAITHVLGNREGQVSQTGEPC